jgi:hypothetical protein
MMNTWKDRGVQMTVREFEEEGDDADCLGYREAAIREACQAEKDAVEEWEHPTEGKPHPEGNHTQLRGTQVSRGGVKVSVTGRRCVTSTSTGGEE